MRRLRSSPEWQGDRAGPGPGQQRDVRGGRGRSLPPGRLAARQRNGAAGNRRPFGMAALLWRGRSLQRPGEWPTRAVGAGRIVTGRAAMNSDGRISWVRSSPGSLARPGPPGRLQSFDPSRVAGLECAAWVAYYYRRRWLRLLVAAVGPVRAGLGMNGRLRCARPGLCCGPSSCGCRFPSTIQSVPGDSCGGSTHWSATPMASRRTRRNRRDTEFTISHQGRRACRQALTWQPGRRHRPYPIFVADRGSRPPAVPARRRPEARCRRASAR